MSCTGEDTLLLPVTSRGATRKSVYCFKRSYCIKSKAACLILLWNFPVLLTYKGIYDFSTVMQVSHLAWAPIFLNVLFAFIAALSPVAGIMTDVKFSRHFAVRCTSYMIIVKLLVVLAIAIISVVFWRQVLERRYVIMIYSGLMIFATVYVVFIINAIQFGMDQLHDSTTEDSILFIYWYVWIYYVCSLIVEFLWNLVFHNFDAYSIDMLRIVGFSLSALTFAIILFLLTLSVCIFHYRRTWFYLEQMRVNSYKMVYGVTKFAFRHKSPLRRSAFTFCDEEMPSRMDFGKHKYGGPFTTKEVEDVKAFWGVLKVLIFIGPTFLLQTVTQSTLPAFARHGNINYLNISHWESTEVYSDKLPRHIIISNGLLSPMLVGVFIPLILCCVRSNLYYFLGIFNRIKIAILVLILSLLCSLVFDVIVHLKDSETSQCMFNGYSQITTRYLTTGNVTFPSPPLYQNVYFFISQHVLSSVVNMLLDVAVLEFICSQSPYSMKGFLIGSSFAIRSLFQGIGIASFFPFKMLWRFETLSCGSGFYLIYVVIAIIEFAICVCATKRYKYRNENEPSNEYRYAEEYYSKQIS